MCWVNLVGAKLIQGLAFSMDDEGAVELDAATAAEAGCECAWGTPAAISTAITKYENGHFCGSTDIPGKDNFKLQRAICCGAEFDKVSDAVIDCGLPLKPEGPAYSSIKKFANNEDKWIKVFKGAWKIVTNNGFSLKRFEADTAEKRWPHQSSQLRERSQLHLSVAWKLRKNLFEGFGISALTLSDTVSLSKLPQTHQIRFEDIFSLLT